MAACKTCGLEIVTALDLAAYTLTPMALRTFASSSVVRPFAAVAAPDPDWPWIVWNDLDEPVCIEATWLRRHNLALAAVGSRAKRHTCRPQQ